MPTPRQILESLLSRRDLPERDAGELLQWLAQGESEPALAGGLLAALRAKGVTAAEVRGFAGAMRGLAHRACPRRSMRSTWWEPAAIHRAA